MTVLTPMIGGRDEQVPWIGPHRPTLPQEERRRSHRFPLITAVLVTRGSDAFRGITEDVSLDGLCFSVEGGPPLAVGDELSCRFALPDLEGELEVRGEVRWVHRGQVRRVGVQLTVGLRPREVWALLRL